MPQNCCAERSRSLGEGKEISFKYSLIHVSEMPLLLGECNAAVVWKGAERRAIVSASLSTTLRVLVFEEKHLQLPSIYG